MGEPYVGEIRMAAYNFAPKNFALCNGQSLPIAQNQALFSLLGTTYGGNGVTTFALPNLQGRVPLHWGNNQFGNTTLGEAGGEAGHTLAVGELPAHTHTLTAAAAPAADQRGPSGNYLGLAQQGGGNFSLYAGGAATGTLDPGVVGQAGGGQPHNNMQPYQVVSFYIALNGIFPSRN